MELIINIKDNKFFKVSFGIILILIILILINQVPFITRAFRIITSLFIIPMLLGGFLYYLLRPLVKILTRFLKYKTVAIFISFIIILTIIIFIIYFGGNIITEQTKNLANQLSDYYYSQTIPVEKDNIFFEVGNRVMEYLKRFNIQERLSNFIGSLVEVVKNNIFGIFTTLTNIGTVIVLIPFVVYYLLKDDLKIKNTLVRYLPSDKQEINKLIKKIDDTLSKYIIGQIFVAFILGVLTYIGFLIIGLPNALILSAIVMVTSFIPFLGAILGILPAIFIGISHSFLLVIKIIIVLIVVQQIEGNIIQPRVQGKRLKIHPLVVIFTVLIFITLFGFIGALYAVPAYAVARVIFVEYHDKYMMSKQNNG
ncbi:MAG: AI-2E family transporter [Halanaerobiales bacterium]|nr:AI-2E family transporter [Halanaerobiales bacterium]